MSVAAVMQAAVRALRPAGRAVAGRGDAVGALATPERVWLAHVQRNSGARSRLLAHAQSAGSGVDGAAAFGRSGGRQRAPMHLLLATAQYQILQLDAPAVPRAEWVAATRWRLKDFIDYDPAEAQLDCVAIPAEDGTPSNRILTVVARQDTVRQLMVDHLRAKLPLSSIDVPEMALRNLLLLTGDGPAQALMHLGRGDCWIVLLWSGELAATRRIDIGLQTLANADGEDRYALVERLALEFQRTSDAFARAYTQGELRTLWVSAGARSVELAGELGAMLSTSVRGYTLADHLDVDGEVPSDPDFVLAVGAALRQPA